MDTEEIERLREIAHQDRADAERQEALRSGVSSDSTTRLEAAGLSALGAYGLLTLAWCAWPSPAIRSAALGAAGVGIVLLFTRQAIWVGHLVRSYRHSADAPAAERKP